MAIRIDEVKSSGFSDDKTEFIIVGGGKYVGEVKLSFGRECLDSLIDALVQAKQDRHHPRTVLAVAANSTPSSDRNEHDVADRGEVRFEIPKKFTVTTDTSGRGLVLVIFNHGLQDQRGYALSTDAAIQVAGGMSKTAEVLVARKAQVPPIEPPHGP